ncbi:hypothetical protein ACFSLT_09480 [Novosphingobium resinovorum]
MESVGDDRPPSRQLSKSALDPMARRSLVGGCTRASGESEVHARITPPALARRTAAVSSISQSSTVA